MRELKKRMDLRAHKDSPEGRRVDEVLEIRTSASPGWDHEDGYDMELTFIVTEGDLPPFDLDGEVTEAVQKIVAAGNVIEIATQLEREDLPSADRSALWVALAQAWTKLVELPEEGRLKRASGTAESEGSYTLARYNRSARMDLDRLGAS